MEINSQALAEFVVFRNVHLKILKVARVRHAGFISSQLNIHCRLAARWIAIGERHGLKSFQAAMTRHPSYEIRLEWIGVRSISWGWLTKILLAIALD